MDDLDVDFFVLLFDFVLLCVDFLLEFVELFLLPDFWDALEDFFVDFESEAFGSTEFESEALASSDFFLFELDFFLFVSVFFFEDDVELFCAVVPESVSGFGSFAKAIVFRQSAKAMSRNWSHRR